MTNASVYTVPTYFINVFVDIAYQDGDYVVTYSPSNLRICMPDTVINYQIAGTGGRVIRFIDMVPKNAAAQSQLSNAAISASGLLLTLSDANTQPDEMHLVFEFEDVGNGHFFHDPQIVNDPQR
jgi:hypothetical protein